MYSLEQSKKVKDGDYWIVKEAEPVAENINTETVYYSLQKAIDEAGAEDTIHLLRDINLSAIVNVSKSLTIDGTKGEEGNFTIKREGGRAIQVTGASSENRIVVNIKNLNVSAEGTGGSGIGVGEHVQATITKC